MVLGLTAGSCRQAGPRRQTVDKISTSESPVAPAFCKALKICSLRHDSNRQRSPTYSSWGGLLGGRIGCAFVSVIGYLTATQARAAPATRSGRAGEGRVSVVLLCGLFRCQMP